MAISHIIILGAGPAGLSAAIALSKVSTPANPLRITVVEVRPKINTIGGAVNLTPIALRYLDFLGAGARLRSNAHIVAGIDVISLRNGKVLGSLSEGVDAVRVTRKIMVESLLETVLAEHSDNVEVKFGMKVTSIEEEGDRKGDGKVVLGFEGGDTLKGDVLLGCDGLHSAARRLYVEPGRKETYTGRVVTMGFADVEDGDAKVRLSSGKPAVRSTSLVSGLRGSLLISWYEQTKSRVFLASVMSVAEPSGDVRDGWKLIGKDGDFLKKDILSRYPDGSLSGIQSLVSRCEEWNLYPVYSLPPGGVWSRGRALLLGDAAHAMPPQGESTAYSIEDSVLLAHVFSRRDTRDVDTLFADYEGLRRSVTNVHYKEAEFRWSTGNADSSWLRGLIVEWFTILYLIVQRWRQEDHFSSDVRKLELPK